MSGDREPWRVAFDLWWEDHLAHLLEFGMDIGNLDLPSSSLWRIYKAGWDAAISSEATKKMLEGGRLGMGMGMGLTPPPKGIEEWSTPLERKLEENADTDPGGEERQRPGTTQTDSTGPAGEEARVGEPFPPGPPTGVTPQGRTGFLRPGTYNR